MLKNFKIITINIFLIVLIVLFIEFLCFCKYFYTQKDYWKNIDIKNIDEINMVKNDAIFFAKQIYTKYFNEIYWNNYEFRTPNIINLNNDSILLLGCSFTYGQGLNEDETLSFKLANKTNYNVYNFGIPGAGLREMLYILNSNYLESKINNNSVKYVIYTFLKDHIRRVYYNHRPIAPDFFINRKNQKLIYLPFSKFLSIRSIQNYKKYKFHKQIKDLYAKDFLLNKNSNLYDKELIKLYFKEINNQIKKQYPNAQFIIYNFDNEKYELLDELKETEGIKIIHSSNILNTNVIQPQYQISKTDPHPNALAWDIIIPALAKELNLNQN